MEYLCKHKPYTNWVKEQLAITKVRVHKWELWCGDLIYEAYPESRRVRIPKPVCAFSFLVCLHEIGHISAGVRDCSYLSEYAAEQWAIKRAASYNVRHVPYEVDAKLNVLVHLVENLSSTQLELKQVKPRVLNWLGTDVTGKITEWYSSGCKPEKCVLTHDRLFVDDCPVQVESHSPSLILPGKTERQ